MSEQRIKILVRRNLKMTPGKMAAQCVHAAMCLHGADSRQSVVVLEVSDKKFYETNPLGAFTVKDKGFTELPEGTETCKAFLEEDPRQ